MKVNIKMKTILSPLSILFLLLMAFCNLGCVNKDITYSQQQLQKVVDEYLKDKKNILGTIVKVDVQDKQSFAAASGYFDLSRKTSIHPGDRFITGSITKVFTAVLVHQLIEAGKVELQKPLIDYLPSDWAAVLSNIKYGREITVEQALSHRSGLANVSEKGEFMKALILAPSKTWMPIDILKLTQQKGEPRFKPGKDFDYNNANYLLLGALIENITKQPFVVSLQQNILSRIGMGNTFLSEGTFGSGQAGILHGYYKAEDKIYDGQEFNVGWAQASGGIISSADDLVTFFKALVDHKLFERKDTFKHMIGLAGGNETYGLGLMVVDDPEIGLYYGHGGSFVGTRSILAYFPEHQTTIVVCHTYDDVAVPGADDLMKLVMKNILHYKSEDMDKSKAEVRDILADNLKVHENEDKPALGNWDFDVKELWSINNIEGHPLAKGFSFNVGSDGEIYLLDPQSGKIFVLDPNGNLLSSFGEEEEQTGYASEMFITSDRINVFEIGNTVNRIQSFDKKGAPQGSFKIWPEISPRVFVNEEQYLSVRSETGIDKKQAYETLELLALKNDKGSVIGKFLAEEKLTVSTNLFMGRAHIMLDDIELFPRLIVHLDKDMLYLGRSDRYLVRKIDLQGNEALAFTIKGRNRKSIPNHFKEDKIAGIGLVGGKEMPDAMKKEIFDGIPGRQVFFTDIKTDEQGLIYVFVPDLGNMRRQEIDIFSQEGNYLYSGVIELTKGLKKVGQFVLKGEDLYALAESDNKVARLIHYIIKIPKLNKEK
jgi:D-alanyl-D-alanine carboxypeptidase